MNNDTKGKPIPIRFEPPLDFLIETLARKTGFSKSEIIRRCVRLAKQEMAERGTEIIYPLVEEERPLTKLKRKRKS